MPLMIFACPLNAALRQVKNLTWQKNPVLLGSAACPGKFFVAQELTPNLSLTKVLQNLGRYEKDLFIVSIIVLFCYSLCTKKTI